MLSIAVLMRCEDHWKIGRVTKRKLVHAKALPEKLEMREHGEEFVCIYAKGGVDCEDYLLNGITKWMR